MKKYLILLFFCIMLILTTAGCVGDRISDGSDLVPHPVYID